MPKQLSTGGTVDGSSFLKNWKQQSEVAIMLGMLVSVFHVNEGPIFFPGMDFELANLCPNYRVGARL